MNQERHVTAVPTAAITLRHFVSDEHPEAKIISMESLDIQGFTYEQRNHLLPDLASAFSNCGGWVIDRKTLSPTNMQFHVELQLRAALDLYAAIVATGLELTRSGHKSFTELCTRCKHLPVAAELGQTVSIRFEVTFLDDFTLRSLLVTRSTMA